MQPHRHQAGTGGVRRRAALGQLARGLLGGLTRIGAQFDLGEEGLMARPALRQADLRHDAVGHVGEGERLLVHQQQLLLQPE